MKTMLAAIAALIAAASAQGQEAAFHYDGGMEITPETGRVALDWELAVLEPELEQVSFLLSAAYGVAEVTGEAVLSVDAAPFEAFGGGVMLYEITLAPQTGETPRRIGFRYEGRPMDPPPQHGINSISPRKAEFTVDSFWMPFDQRFSSLITAELAVALAETDVAGWVGVSTEPVERSEAGFILRQQRPSLDLAFTLMADPVVSGEGDYRIYDARETPGGGVEAVEGGLAFCTDYLNALSGPGDLLPNAAIVLHDRDAAGYSRGTLIALTDVAETEPEPLTQFICHELGHYWSSGNPMTVENWLNESFADYVAIMGERERFGEAAFEARMTRYAAQVENHDGELPPVWTPETTARGPYLNNYRRGPLALAELEGMMGREAFYRFMQRYMQDRIATTSDMLDAVEAIAGPEVRAAFEADLAR